MTFVIYNNLSKKKELFVPLKKNTVNMYCCGPTVYDLLHIGNFRGAVFFNFLCQWLEHKNYKVNFVYNFTDVDDKILNRAKKENKTMKEIADKYIAEFKKDFQTLKLRQHDHNPQATQFIPDMIKLIQALCKKGKAYTTSKGDVFFHVNSFSEYGKLSGRKTEELISGARVEVNEAKKDPKDFALWKACPKEEPGWDSPWGRGRPGWHIECTSMIFSLLGTNIDIHGGGTDLLFPHHENEIAQAEGAEKGLFAKYWVHNNMFTLGGEKMAKSTGNLTLMRSFIEKYHGEIFKYMVLSSHYRSMIEVSEKKVLQSIQSLQRIYVFLQKAEEIKNQHNIPNSTQVPDEILIKAPNEIKQVQKNIEQALNDDLNTPVALACLFSLIRRFNDRYKTHINREEQKLAAQHLSALIQKYGKIMSLFQEPPADFLYKLDDIFLRKNNLNRKDIDNIVEERVMARRDKDFNKADKLREQLLSMKIEVKDNPDGSSSWETQKL